MKEQRTYLITVKTTNYTEMHTKGPGGSYRACERGILYVTTDDPRKIYDEFPEVIIVNNIGNGYTL